jgi:hypothetical protein
MGKKRNADLTSDRGSTISNSNLGGKCRLRPPVFFFFFSATVTSEANAACGHLFMV